MTRFPLGQLCFRPRDFRAEGVERTIPLSAPEDSWPPEERPSKAVIAIVRVVPA